MKKQLIDMKLGLAPAEEGESGPKYVLVMVVQDILAKPDREMETLQLNMAFQHKTPAKDLATAFRAFADHIEAETKTKAPQLIGL